MNSLITRIIVAIIFGGLLVLFSFLSRILFFCLIALFVIGATKELLKIFSLKGISLTPLFLLFNFITILLVYLSFPLSVTFFLFFAFMGLMTILKKPFSSFFIIYGTFIFTYLGFLPSHIFTLMRIVDEKGYSTWLFLFPFFFTWLNDTIAYIFGSIFGKHKLSAEISPQKTWEGFIFSLFLPLPFTLIYLKIQLRNIPLISFFFLSLALSFLALIGDLLESILKREVSLKDSSRSLLAHGGFLDRIDSLLFTIPAFYYYLLFLH